MLHCGLEHTERERTAAKWLHFSYDAAGNRLSLTDPVGNTTRWAYDSLGRVVEETNQLGDTRYFTYDAAGRLLRRVDQTRLLALHPLDDPERHRLRGGLIDGQG